MSIANLIAVVAPVLVFLLVLIVLIVLFRKKSTPADVSMDAFHATWQSARDALITAAQQTADNVKVSVPLAPGATVSDFDSNSLGAVMDNIAESTKFKNAVTRGLVSANIQEGMLVVSLWRS